VTLSVTLRDTDVSPNALTGQTKANSPSDPDYVAPVINVDLCPIPTPPTSGREIIGREGVTEIDACSAPYFSYYINLSYLVPEVGTIIYTNLALTTPLVAREFFITDSGVCELDISTGEVLNINPTVSC